MFKSSRQSCIRGFALAGAILLPLAGHCAQERFYIGTYTGPNKADGVYTGLLDSDTGKLSGVQLAIKANNPGFLALSPDQSHLYAVGSEKGGSVSAYSVGKDGGLTFLNTVSSQGNGPCHLSVDHADKNVLVANYGDGTIASIHLKDDGSLGDSPSKIQFSGTGPNTGRQAGPHAHFIVTDAGDKHVLACDLGTDHVWSYQFDSATGKIGDPVALQGKVDAGSGSRHLAFGPGEKFAYVNGEMGRNITVFKHNADTGELLPVQSLQVVPGKSYDPAVTTAEVVCDPSGKWVYVTSRGDDIIAQFAIGGDGMLTFVQDVPALVKVPRGAGIDPSGHWLMTGGQNGGGIAVLGIDHDTGKLTPAGATFPVPAAICVLFAH